MKKKLRPIERERVMDLVEQAGIDISDWSNFKGGIEKAAANPKYCYEWSYVNPKNKVVVLNLWYSNIEFVNGEFIYNLNPRRTANEESGAGGRAKRAFNMDFALQKVVRESLPIRIIICDTNGSQSRVERRLLDSDFWYVTSYDSDTGECGLKRGMSELQYVDQFETVDIDTVKPEKKESVAFVYERSSYVRKEVLNRAKGLCEWCGKEGFTTESGAIYLESHHIIPLSESGDDSSSNVIALCPNDHRKCHYGKDKENYKAELLKIVDNENNKATKKSIRQLWVKSQ